MGRLVTVTGSSPHRILHDAMNPPQASKTPSDVTKLLASFANIKPGPCKGCANATRCASERLACYPFLSFAEGGTPRFMSLRAAPTREYFDMLDRVGDDDFQMPLAPTDVIGELRSNRELANQTRRRRAAQDAKGTS